MAEYSDAVRQDVLDAARALLATRTPGTSSFSMSAVDALMAAVRAADEVDEAES